MIVLIDNYDSFTHNLYQLISVIYKEVKVVRNDCMTLEQIACLKPEGIVLSPGPGRPEEAGICVELIRHFAPTVPILGVCLGHQAIAIAFGGQVIQAPSILHGKSSLIFHRRQEIFKGITLPCRAGRYHSLIVDKISLPDCLQVEAEDTEGTVMAIQHREFPCYGVQFHPESILTLEGQRILGNFLKKVEKC